jgi:hypothetical protein
MAAPQVARAIPTRKSLQEVRGQNLVPVNEHLWTLVQRQARYRFAKFPSPAASKWMHTKYTQMGGRFRDTKNKADAEIHRKNEKKKSPKQKKDEKEIKDQEQEQSKSRSTNKVKAPHRKERKHV